MKKWIALSVAILSLAAGITFTIHKVMASPGSKAKPDLIVDQKRLLQNWVVRDENLPANFCSVVEGGVTPGEHTLLRFTVSTPTSAPRTLISAIPMTIWPPVMVYMNLLPVIAISTFATMPFTNCSMRMGSYGAPPSVAFA